MDGLTADEIKRILENIKDVRLTRDAKDQIGSLADDVLGNYVSPQDLAAKYALFLALINQLVVKPALVK
jgi:hypothetical protein